MPEMKRNFTKGKMNKDLDERLIPNGEYKDAMNIQVSTSDNSDVGTVQNLLGNNKVRPLIQEDIISSGFECVGSISDEKNDKLYWLITNETVDYPDVITSDPNGRIYKDCIIEYNKASNIVTPVFVDIWGIEFPWGGVNLAMTGLQTTFTLINTTSVKPGMRVKFKSSVSFGYDFEREIVSIAGNVITVDQEYGASSYISGIRIINSATVELIPEIVIEGITVPARENTIPERVLNFRKQDSFNLFPTTITGINIIDGMLFWTDNKSEPKKINIQRSIQGTNPSGNDHTLLINEAQEYKIGAGWAGADASLFGGTTKFIREQHITVIRKGPKKALSLSFDTARDPNLKYAGITTTAVDPESSLGINKSSIISASLPGTIWGFSSLSLDPPTVLTIEIETDLTGGEDFTLQWQVGDILLLKEFEEDGTAPAIPLASWTIRAQIIEWDDTSFTSNAADATGYPDGQIIIGTAHVQIEVLGLNGTPPSPYDGFDTLNYVVDLEQQEETIFELKFPRFSYRYKYEDGEYSTFAPWTEVAFVPGTFNYEPRKAWNIGMVNIAQRIILKDFVSEDIPEDVVSVDILYKEETSPNIYIVETIAPLDDIIDDDAFNHWNSNEYKVTSETVKATLPSNQLLRPWDNVPRKALAQEITGNRIVYANYLQGFDLQEKTELKFKPTFKSYLRKWGDRADDVAQKSIKSLRDYKLGVVFTDKYGRETPILTSKSGGFKVEKKDSINANRLKVGLRGDPPANMDYLKFYIKETSSEYYNLVMDRWYEAEDGNIWVAFPSSDRNKVDIDTTLYLKKGDGDYVDNLDKYKIIAIENEAPIFIKTNKIRIGSVTHDATKVVGSGFAQVFGDAAAPMQSAPIVGGRDFSLGYVEGEFNKSSLSKLDEITDDLYINFESSTNNSGQYRVSKLTVEKDDVDTSATNSNLKKEKYHISLDTSLKEDINFIFDSGDSLTASKIRDGVKIRFTQALIEKSPKFDGRFFAKIANDGKIKVNITDDSIGVVYNEVATRKIYLLENDYTLRIRSNQAFIHKHTKPGFGLNKVVNYVTDPDLDNIEAYNGDFYKVVNDFQNPNGDHFQYLNARQCFFGLHNNTEQDVETPVGEDFDFEASRVWFIDKSTLKYNIRKDIPNTLRWQEYWKTGSKFKTNFNNSLLDDVDVPANGADFMQDFNTGGNNWYDGYLASFGGPLDAVEHYASIYTSGGIVTTPGVRSVVQLAFGGIDCKDGLRNLIKRTGVHGVFVQPQGSHPYSHEHISVSTSGLSSKFWYHFNKLYIPEVTGGGYSDYKIPTFFGVGEDSPVYDSEKLFVESFTSGTTFRWAEDPSETVYTVFDEVDTFNGVRFNPTDDGYHPAWNPADHNPDIEKFDSSWEVDDKPFKSKHYHREWLINNPSSYHKRWKLKITPEMVWDPVGTTNGEPIKNGLSLGLSEEKLEFTNTVVGTPTIVGISNLNAELKLKVGMTVSGTGFDPKTKIISIVSSAEIELNQPPTAIVDEAQVGFTIRCTDIGNTSGASAGEPIHIFVDNIEAESFGGSDVYNSVNNELFSLKSGMRFMIYNYDSTSEELNNTIIKTEMPPGESPIEYDSANDQWKITLTGWETGLSLLSEFGTAMVVGEKLNFRQVTMNSVSNFTEINTDACADHWGTGNHGIGAIGYNLKILTAVEEYDDGAVLPQNPFVWETEPKENTELDIYYEISGQEPINLNSDTIEAAIPIGSIVQSALGLGWSDPATVEDNNSVTGDIIKIWPPAWVGPGVSGDGVDPLVKDSIIRITRPNGIVFTVSIREIRNLVKYLGGSGYYSDEFGIESDIYNSSYILNWHNCYSFGNGVESNRIRDSFNFPFILNGVKASTTLTEEYKEERRKYGLIYSGIYNSTSGVNNLNQFIAAEKITKDINPTYGSIQKLYAGWGQQGNLIALCEDRVLSILANKDALYNADGDTNVVSTNRVLGTATPYSGEYGISKNPESFASESYRAYFTDKVRGTVMRLSMDGLTAISNYGMRDWFRDNLKLSTSLVGSYDDKKDEYNITLKGNEGVDKREKPGYPTTVSFREDVKGWVSFKSFVPENAISCANDYYTFDKGTLYLHHDESGSSIRNTFYTNHTPTSIEVIFNKMSGSVKSFKTLNYEGSQARVTTPINTDITLPQFGAVGQTLIDGEYFNLQEEKGWYVTKAKTNCEVGKATDFIEKECKWFGHLVGNDVTYSEKNPRMVSSNFETSDFSIQGIGTAQVTTSTDVYGCTDPLAINYDPNATIDDGSCIAAIPGCMLKTADNYNPNANVDDGSCFTSGCMLQFHSNYPGDYGYQHLNFDPNADVPCNDFGTDNDCCDLAIAGCTDNTMSNYDPNANTACGGNYLVPGDGLSGNNLSIPQDPDYCCINPINGCTDPAANNYNSSATNDDGSCIYAGCTNSMATNYDPLATIDDGSCIVPGCTDNTACNYNSTATVDDGSCEPMGCTDTTANNHDPIIGPGCDDGSCTYPVDCAGVVNGTAVLDQCGVCDGDGTSCQGCMDPAGGGYDATFIADCLGNFAGWDWGYGDTSCCTYPIPGCTDPLATNYDPTATTDNGSCTYPVYGCTNPNSCDYDALATVDDGSCRFDCPDISTILATDTSGDQFFEVYIDTTNSFSGFTIDELFGWNNPPTLNAQAGCTYSPTIPPPVPPGLGVAQVTKVEMMFKYHGNTPINSHWNLPSSSPVGSIYYPSTTLHLATGANHVGSQVSGNNSPQISLNQQHHNYDAPLNGWPATSSIPTFQPITTAGVEGYYVRVPVLEMIDLSKTEIQISSSTYLANAVRCNSLGGSPCTKYSCTPASNVTYTIGCTDPTAYNTGSFDITANNQCTYTIPGCTDPTATNYNAAATVDDGSCTYPTPGCTDPTANNYNASATTDDGSCIYDVLGCTDPLATNYDATATIDDGSCIYPPCPQQLVFNSITGGTVENTLPYLNLNVNTTNLAQFSNPVITWSKDGTIIDHGGLTTSTNPTGTINILDLYPGAGVSGLNASNYIQTISDLGDSTSNGYMGDGTYTATMIDDDGCTQSISFNVVIGCGTSSGQANYNANTTIQVWNYSSSPFIYPGDIGCV